MSDTSPQIYDDGSSAWPLEDGAGWVAFDAEGEPIGAVDADGDPIDHTGIVHPDLEEDDGYDGYVESDDEPDYDPVADELQQRMAQLEQHAAQPYQTEVVYDTPPQPTDEEFTRLADRALEELETARGHPLTGKEADTFLQDYWRDFESGTGADTVKSALASGLDRDFSRHEDRTAYMTERLADAEREETGEDYTPDPQPQRDSYDLDNMEQRHAYLADRVNGADVEDLAYRSSDNTEGETGQPLPAAYYDEE